MARKKRTRRKKKSSVGQYGVYLLAAVVAACWLAPGVGGGVVVLVSLALVGYGLFGVPMWCAAATREPGGCRNNAYGVLMGCHLRQHKWQKLKLAFVPRCWERLNRGLWVTPTARLATLAAMAGIVSAVSGVFKPG